MSSRDILIEGITIAALALVVTKYPVDGWSFRKYEHAPGEWVRLDELRK